MIKRILQISILILPITWACKNIITADQIVNKAIEKAGGETFDRSDIKFSFRDMNYRIIRQNETFSMFRYSLLDSNEVEDIYSNKGFQRKINGISVALPDSMQQKYTSSINSVIYFALLPYRLNDAAVLKKYLGTSTIIDKTYDVIQVTFEEEGGGEDHEDVFIYWIDTQNSTIDFLAYSYKTDGGGFRFREAYNARIIEGIRFVDYINYKPTSEPQSLLELMEVYKKDELEELSRIELFNISVEAID